MLKNVFSILELEGGDQRGCEKNWREQGHINPDHEAIVQCGVDEWQEKNVAESQSSW